MPMLTIDLQDGFASDEVVIQVNGQEIYRRNQVSTNYAISRAASVQQEVPAGRAVVKITLPLKGLAQEIPLAISGPTYLALSIMDGRVSHSLSDEPFRYL